jgi:hypothetical protein
LNGIGDDKGGHLLFERDDVIDRDNELETRSESKEDECGWFTHIGDPTKDISMEANVVLRDVYAALNENLTLQGTAVV